jgi:hypothetical protein
VADANCLKALQFALEAGAVTKAGLFTAFEVDAALTHQSASISVPMQVLKTCKEG